MPKAVNRVILLIAIAAIFAMLWVATDMVQFGIGVGEDARRRDGFYKAQNLNPDLPMVLDTDGKWKNYTPADTLQRVNEP